MNRVALAEPATTRQVTYRVSEKENRRIAEVYRDFAAHNNENRKIRLIHPSSVTSRASHSASILPLKMLEAVNFGEIEGDVFF